MKVSVNERREMAAEDWRVRRWHLESKSKMQRERKHSIYIRTSAFTYVFKKKKLHEYHSANGFYEYPKDRRIFIHFYFGRNCSSLNRSACVEMYFNVFSFI